MTDDKETIDALKSLLADLHVIRQQEQIRARINELSAAGMETEKILESLKRQPPVLRPVI